MDFSEGCSELFAWKFMATSSTRRKRHPNVEIPVGQLLPKTLKSDDIKRMLSYLRVSDASPGQVSLCLEWGCDPLFDAHPRTCRCSLCDETQDRHHIPDWRRHADNCACTDCAHVRDLCAQADTKAKLTERWKAYWIVIIVVAVILFARIV